jgi:protein-S-isoprenylcysteine O-methyltransferase Ste14
MHDFPDIPPIWTIGLGLIAWVLARILPLWSFGWGTLPGIALIVAGFALAIWGLATLRGNGTTFRISEPPTRLVAEGPFRFNRNPVYTGFTAILLGWAFWLGALTAFLPAIALPIIISLRFIGDEEAALRLAFGPEAERYLAATRRW